MDKDEKKIFIFGICVLLVMFDAGFLVFQIPPRQAKPVLGEPETPQARLGAQCR